MTPSIATKIDAPLIETARSISIVDRQTLYYMGVDNRTVSDQGAIVCGASGSYAGFGETGFEP